MLAHRSLTRAAAFAVLLGGIALAAPSFAQPPVSAPPSGAPNSSINFDANGHVVSQTPDTSEGSVAMQPGGTTTADMGQGTSAAPMHHRMHAQKAEMKSGETKQQEVEERITTLHEKLMITKEQEPKWEEVAQAMRDSESTVGAEIKDRHENRNSMTAVDDLQSYQKIAQDHADGLGKVIGPFKSLYAEMTPEQQNNADKVFGGFEGRGDMHKASYHKHHTAPSAPTAQ